MTHVTCRLTAKNRDQLRNPTLRNRVWATFTFFTRVSRYQKGRTNLDFTEARDTEWQWHQLGHMQVCISLQTDNHASAPPLSFLQAGCPSCHPTNSIKAPKAMSRKSSKINCRYPSSSSSDNGADVRFTYDPQRRAAHISFVQGIAYISIGIALPGSRPHFNPEIPQLSIPNHGISGLKNRHPTKCRICPKSHRI